MSLTTEWLPFGSDAEFRGFAAWPGRAVGPLPALMVIQEAWGVDDHIEDVTRRFAAAGYFALAPDLFSKGGGRPPALAKERVRETIEFINGLTPEQRCDPAGRAAALAKLSPDEGAHIGETLTTMFSGGYLPAVLAAARFLHEAHPTTRGQKLVSVGFCMGGALSAQLAGNDPELTAAVIFYGRSPPADVAAKIRCPVRGFYGALDPVVNQTVAPFAEILETQGVSFEATTYEGAQHAFFNDDRPMYHVAAARDAFARVLAFFASTLA